MVFGKGIAVWISGFFTFLAGLNTFNAVMLWVHNGPDLIIGAYSNFLQISGILVRDYFWGSLIATFGFLGILSLIAYGRSSPYQIIREMIGDVETGLSDTQRKIDDANAELAAKLEMDRIENHQLSDTVNTNIGNARKEMLNAIDIHGKVLERNREDFLHSVKTGFSNMRKEMLGMLESRAEAIHKDLLSTTQTDFGNVRKEMKDMQMQIAAVEDVKTRLETLRMELTLPKPRLNSYQGPEEIRGVGPHLGAELRSVGISNIGEFLTTDPLIIAEKTPISLDMVTRFQARAQLLMIPGVDEIDAEMLENVGIHSKGELASQNSIHLSKRIAEVVKAFVEKGKITKSESPTIEEVSSWIKYANL
jgi:hypothetical protein